MPKESSKKRRLSGRREASKKAREDTEDVADDVDTVVETPDLVEHSAKDSSPPTEEPVPATEEANPVTDEAIPAAEELTPSTEKLTPATEISPLSQETTPAADEVTPATEESNPVAVEPTPIDIEPTPATEQVQSIAEEPVVATEEVKPATEETTPVIEKAKPEDEVFEVAPPEKEKPEMIVLDDTEMEDDGPDPDEVPTAEERGFWRAVEENPGDFASWTYLLQVVEKNGKLKQTKKAFTQFLTLYPYCYGYWKKYADQMKKLVSQEAAFEIFNDAVKAIPLSVDLWTYFIHFVAEWKEGNEDEIRAIYQRAVEACGEDYRSDKIWEAYVEWEKQTDGYRVFHLYKTFLGCVVQRHQHHFDKFREWIFFTPVKDMVSLADIKELLGRHQAEAEKRRLETERKLKEDEERARKAAEAAAAEAAALAAAEAAAIAAAEAAAAEAAAAEAALAAVKSEADAESETTAEAPTEATTEPTADVEQPAVKEEESMEVEEPQDTTEDPKPPAPSEEAAPAEEIKKEEEEAAATVEEPVIPTTPAPPPPETLPESYEELTTKQEAAVREQMLLDMAPIHERILAEVEEVAGYEEGIKRPYFHVKELERVQLKNWRNYLDHVIGKKSIAKTRTLFERCLIACALYENFWIKYANFMKENDVEETSKIYRRACMTHLPKKPQVHLNWAAFEEQRGQVAVAREALNHIDKNMPGLIAVILRRAGLERRCGNLQQGADILKTAVQASKGATRDFWALKYLSYTQYVLGTPELGQSFLEEEVDANQNSMRLYAKLLDMQSCTVQRPVDVTKAVTIFQKALESKLSADEKAVFSHRRLTFLEEHSDTIEAIIIAYDDHVKNWKTAEKKRPEPAKDKKMGRDKMQGGRSYNNQHYNKPQQHNYGHHQGYHGGYQGQQQQWYQQQYNRSY